MAGAPQAVGEAESEVREGLTGSLGGDHKQGSNGIIGCCEKDETLSLCLGKLFPPNRALFVPRSSSGGTKNPIGEREEPRADCLSSSRRGSWEQGGLGPVPGALEPQRQRGEWAGGPAGSVWRSTTFFW